ncbi:transforming growth factor-beta-induced protein ig-h3-like [Thrips palmi]|uniref:Transforming growth factor-beta-induced protein ig-h3-like n=1 Tax=Thrips palmi TaxID=161013 RepID=A0A6P8ZST4_THRPL|nr:transforming growth factor-beta-induced protein ig-h3-like [Thrips palmi]
MADSPLPRRRPLALDAVAALLVLGVLVGGLPSVAANLVSDINIKIAQEQGPNTCVIEEVPGTEHKIWTECKYWADRDVCGRKAVVRYDCCEGFSRVEGQHGCTGVLPLQDVVKTAGAAGAARFAALLESSGLADQLRAEGAAFTLFAPSDQAMDELTSSQLAALRGARADNPVLNHHVVANKQLSRAWGADQLLPSRLRGSSLRVNKYSSKIETVNCATIVRKDQEASNGVVHIVDTLLDPERSTYSDLSTAVVQDGRFRQLSRLMQRSELFNAMRSHNQAYTLLAPNDEAFQKMPAARLQRLENDDQAREALLRHLVLPHPVCLGAVVGPHRFPTKGPERLAFDCDARGVSVEGMRFGAGATADMTLAADGFLYMLDEVPLPNRVKTLLQLTQDERLYSFGEVVRAAGLESLLDGPGDYTLFAPSEAAMASLPFGQMNRLRADQGAARSFVMLHVSRGRILTETITDNQVAQTLESDSLRLQVYRKSYGVEDALVERADVQGLNGVLHVITKALRAANATLEETLRQDANYTTFLRAMDRLREDSANSLEFRGSRTAYTFLVPSDEAFQRLGVTRLKQLLANTTLLARTLKNHVVDDMVGTESFRENLQYAVPSRYGGLNVTRADGRLKVNDATVLTCDRTNRQGVVHYINKVLMPPDHHHHHHHVTVVAPSVPPYVTQRTQVHWEERVEERDESDQDDDEEYVDPDLGRVDPDLGPLPEVYRGRERAGLGQGLGQGLQEHRYREDRVGPRHYQHQQQHNVVDQRHQRNQYHQQSQHHQRHNAARVQHSTHHYLQSGSNNY